MSKEYFLNGSALYQEVDGKLVRSKDFKGYGKSERSVIIPNETGFTFSVVDTKGNNHDDCIVKSTLPIVAYTEDSVKIQGVQVLTIHTPTISYEICEDCQGYGKDSEGETCLSCAGDGILL